jgi:hypothetical protein
LSDSLDKLRLEISRQGIGVSEKMDTASERLSKVIDKASTASEAYAGKLVAATKSQPLCSPSLACLYGSLEFKPLIK